MTNNPVIVTNVIQTCTACPAQFEGTTSDGQYIYARYRHGRMRVDLAPSSKEHYEKSTVIYSEEFGDPLDGFITYEELKQHTRGIVEWPDNLDYPDELIREEN